MQLVSAQTSIADRRRASAAKSKADIMRAEKDIMRLEEDSTTLDYGAYNSAESVISVLTGKAPVFACQQNDDDSGATDAPSFDSSGVRGEDDGGHFGLGSGGGAPSDDWSGGAGDDRADAEMADEDKDAAANCHTDAVANRNWVSLTPMH